MIREGDSLGFDQQEHGIAVRVVPSWTGTRQPDPRRWPYKWLGEVHWEIELETGLGPETSQHVMLYRSSAYGLLCSRDA